MRIPLFNRLKKRIHVEIAMLQDEVVDIAYSASPKAVLHGGTAVWRCYSGNRFSEDLDFYLSADEKFRKAFVNGLESRGLALLKYKKSKTTLFSKISNGRAEIRFEAAFRKPKCFEARAFERADGTFMSVFTLPPESLILEKAEAYSARRLARDIYDIYMLSSLAETGKKTGAKMCSFLKKIPKPVDEKNLRTIVFSGAVPSFEQMLAALKRRFHA